MTQALVLCAHREISLGTFQSVMMLASTTDGWRIRIEQGDALICRARSTAISKWLRECPDDDVVVMTDDDFIFYPESIEQLTATARHTKGVVAGVTGLRSGEFAAIVPLNGKLDGVQLKSSDPVQEIRWAGGLIAYHRSVFERIRPTLPLLHERDTIPAFWPFFMPMIAKAVDGRQIYLSEDYACHERARECGCHVYVDPRCQVGHLGQMIVTPDNLEKIRAVHRSMQLHRPSLTPA